ncbi:nucleotide-binding protein [Alkalihalobacillus oceani]|uniref:Nucleotide-binding protein n=1 Tax=Halalkalibacter oceani TaxID=1653776 RepID=A0A9X2DN19_9BACI|nr:nucleotide-binding protein [Halalkalibacter oceani]
MDKETAKKITALIKNSGLKVKSQVQDDQIRVTGKNRDDLQAVITAVKEADLAIDVQFINYR